MRIAGVTVFIKLVVIPLVFLPIAVLAGSKGRVFWRLHLRGKRRSRYQADDAMAQQAGADGELAGQLVVLSAVCCIPTVFLMIFILHKHGVAVKVKTRFQVKASETGFVLFKFIKDARSFRGHARGFFQSSPG